MDFIEVEKGLVLTRHCAAYHAPESVGVVSDLHIGYEAAAAEDGALIPRTNRDQVMRNLTAFIEEYSPHTLVVNGDFKHMFGRNSPQEWREVKEVLSSIVSAVDRLVIVRGNHDNFLAAILPDEVQIVGHIQIGRLWITHGHRRSSLPEEGIKLLGHEHPTILLKDDVGAAIRLKCYLYHRRRRILVLPALSGLSKGSHIHARGFFSPALRDADPAEMEVYAISDIGMLHLP